MTRREILKKLKVFFSTKELVCPHIYARFSESSLDFLDTRLLETLLWIRTNIGKPIFINRGAATQRGMRCNMCEMVKSKKYAYLSSHVLGMGIDFDVKDMDADDVRAWLKANKDNLPYNIRLEENVSWVHLDVRNETAEKIVYFKD